MSKTKKSKKKKWYETGEFADGYQLWDFYKTFKNKKNNEKEDANKKKKSVSQDIKESKNKKTQNTTTYLPRIENGEVSFDPVVQFYGFKNEAERQNYIKENPELYIANGGFKYEPSVLQKNYASISDKEKKNAVEAAKSVIESNKRQEFLSDFGVNKPGKISYDAFARLGGFSNEREMNAYKQKNPELYEAMGGVKYVPYDVPLANEKGYLNSKVAAEKVVKRYENCDMVKIEEIIKKLNNNEWQDADTMEKYSDIVNSYINDYIALGEMGYFNYIPEEKRKADVEFMKNIQEYVNQQKDSFGNYDSAYDYNVGVVWKNKYGSMTWEELEKTVNTLENKNEREYVEKILNSSTKQNWDYTHDVKAAPEKEQLEMIGNVYYDVKAYEQFSDWIKIATETINDSANGKNADYNDFVHYYSENESKLLVGVKEAFVSKFMEDTDEYISFVKNWYNKNGTIDGARDAYITET